jgi:hypothetical protein
MHLDIHHHVSWSNEPPPWAVELHHQGALILNRLETIMSILDDLTAQVAANRTISQSALTLINGIADRITAAGADPKALSDLTASLKSDDDALAAAITANTPATPAAPGA